MDTNTQRLHGISHLYRTCRIHLDLPAALKKDAIAMARHDYIK